MTEKEQRAREAFLLLPEEDKKNAIDELILSAESYRHAMVRWEGMAKGDGEIQMSLPFMVAAFYRAADTCRRSLIRVNLTIDLLRAISEG